MNQVRNKILRFVAIALVGALVQTAYAAKWTSNAPKTVVVSQSVDLEPGFSTSFAVSSGTTRYSNAKGLSVSNSGNLVADPAAVGLTKIPPAAVRDELGELMLSTDLVKTSSQHFAGMAPGIASQLKAYMKANGISSGVFTYSQRVMVENNTSAMHLVWQLMVDSSGKVRYGDATIIADAPKYNNAVYLSKAVDEVLPSTFAYPSAGFIVSSAAGTTDVNGAYDAPQEGDQDSGVRCLINKASDAACPQGFPDMLQLLGMNGATSGVLDYVRRLSPVLDDVVVDAATGETEGVPRIYVRVNNRIWKPDHLLVLSQPASIPATAVSSWFVCADGDELNGSTCIHTYYVTTCVPGPVIDPLAPPPPPVCTTEEKKSEYPAAVYVHMPPTFRNVGQVEYQVESTVDRYSVKFDGTYQKANSSTSTSTQTNGFDKTATLPSGTSCSAYINMIINPFDYRLHPTDPANQPRVADSPPSIYSYASVNPISDLPVANYLYVAAMEHDSYTSPSAPHPSFGAGSGCP